MAVLRLLQRCIVKAITSGFKILEAQHSRQCALSAHIPIHRVYNFEAMASVITDSQVFERAIETQPSFFNSQRTLVRMCRGDCQGGARLLGAWQAKHSHQRVDAVDKNVRLSVRAEKQART